MNDEIKHRKATPQVECQRTRLAHGELAAVDTCRCGMLQLHLGAFTLRMAPEALSELVSTLGEAVAAYAALRYGEQDGFPSLSLRPHAPRRA